MILIGDCRDTLKTLPDRSVHCVVTSPPYFGLRDYGTGSWEGGDPECDHKLTRGQQGPTGQRANRSFTQNVIQKDGCQKDGCQKDGCQKCGATRVDRQVGLEATPDEFVAAMVEVFTEVWRVLRDDGTVWLNLGDSFANDGKWGGSTGGKHVSALHGDSGIGRRKLNTGLKQKDLIGIPWMVAFALREAGWYLRQDIIWAKRNVMPESVRDRCTKAHEYIFLLTKNPKYFFDAEAIKEPAVTPAGTKGGKGSAQRSNETGVNSRPPEYAVYDGLRNKRDVWHVSTKPFKEAHFATFPPDLIEPCILAGTSEKGVCSGCGAPWLRQVERKPMVIRRIEYPELGEFNRVRASGTMLEPARSRTTGWQPSCECNASVVPATVLDPFFGAGTTGLVAQQHGRDWIGCELNPEYVEIARRRLSPPINTDACPLLWFALAA